MKIKSLDYTPIASGYHQRYQYSPHSGTATALHTLLEKYQRPQVLEIGCGTGRWLLELASFSSLVVGLDRSLPMLEQARQNRNTLPLVCAEAGKLPFASASFELVFCANAVHHFPQPQAFIKEAVRLLKPGGTLAIIGMSPPQSPDSWYLYRYFEETYQLDRQRYPVWQTVMQWMASEGLKTSRQVVERIKKVWVGREVQTDPFLPKSSTSQLALLTEESYRRGLARLEEALTAAEKAGETISFNVDIEMGMATGVKPANPRLSPSWSL